MRRTFLLCLLAAAAWAVPVLTTPIEITSISPKSVAMLPGARCTLKFLGRGFESIASAQILRQDVRVRPFDVTWSVVNPQTMELTMAAGKDLPPAPDYRLVFFTRRFSMWVPLRIELLDPNQPAPGSEPLFPDPVPQPSGWFQPKI